MRFFFFFFFAFVAATLPALYASSSCPQTLSGNYTGVFHAHSTLGFRVGAYVSEAVAGDAVGAPHLPHRSPRSHHLPASTTHDLFRTAHRLGYPA
jgi:hypothetical protein